MRPRISWRRSIATSAAFIAASGALNDSVAQAQASRAAESHVAGFVVGVRAIFGVSAESDTIDILGSGVLVGADDEYIYIATAHHVVQPNEEKALGILVTFARPSRVAAAEFLPYERTADLAFLRVRRRQADGSSIRLPPWDRLGPKASVVYADPVRPVGCPNDDCWNIPAEPDRVIRKSDRFITIQSDVITTGHSGGALFNAEWEIIGLVTEDRPLNDVMPIEPVVDLLDTWGVPDRLRAAAIPRQGYPVSIQALALVDSDAGVAESRDGRWPSGRVSLERRWRSIVRGHLAWVRLAPRNIHINAGVAGLTLGERFGRWDLGLFGEVGLARVRSRYDAGGYFVLDGGVDRYVDVWQESSQDGIGAGWGATVQFVVVRHLLLEAMGGHWTFPLPNVPRNAPSLPGIFYGVGLRWGL